MLIIMLILDDKKINKNNIDVCIKLNYSSANAHVFINKFKTDLHKLQHYIQVTSTNPSALLGWHCKLT